MINHYFKKHYPIRATKVELLIFIKEREFVTANDLVDHFRYRPDSARVKLYELAREGLLTSWVLPEQWCLTQLGERKYQYYVKKAAKENSQ